VTRPARTTLVTIGLTAVAVLAVGCRKAAVPAAAPGDWPMYRHDLAGSGASPLAAIDRSNVATLRRAWTYALGSAPDAAAGGRGPRPLRSEATPIVVDGIMFVPAADRVVALDAATGRERWRHPVQGAPSRRGVAYWPGDGGAAPRVIFTVGRRLIALDAATGEPVRDFGVDGAVDMVIPYASVPLVYRDVIVVGANTPPGRPGGIGNARAFDVRTGAKRWEFSSVPPPGAVGHDTWEGDSWRGRLGVNAWPFYFTVDADRGLLYLPLASPIPDAYGGDRPGANLFGNSVVAVDVESGRYRWHFQTIHHDLWDHDPPAPPTLFDIQRGGERVPALGLTTKSGYVYILNRETGEPIFGVEERPMPASDVPGEQAFPTQPIPVKPPPIARTSYSAADLVTAEDTNEEHARLCAALVAADAPLVNRGPFTPWAWRARDAPAPAPTTLTFPGGLGGANWGGPAYDATSGNLIVVSQDVGALGWIQPAAAGSDAPYVKAGPRPSSFDVPMSGTRWPCQKPPWGRLTAIAVSTGDVAWQIPLGSTDELPPGRQNTGRPALAGAINTRGGLLFVASTDDNRFRAFDARTGAQLWATLLDARGNADPLTYQAAGRQFVAVTATDTVVAFALP
jgi:quinoprotein glucose dehydrogenase